jgi:hypothetical protein
LGGRPGGLASTLLDSLPHNTILVAEADHWLAPLWYLQEVEHRRPDVVVLANGLLSSSWYFEHVYRLHPTLRKVALRGPGGARGRLLRLLEAQPERPLAFENEREAQALGFRTCVGPVFAHARTLCNEAPAERARFSQLLARLSQAADAGELTVSGALSTISVARAELLSMHTYTADALVALFAGVDPVMARLEPGLVERVARLPPRPLRVPPWEHEVALGDPARNLFLAAQIAGAAGDHEHAVMWLLLARELGLPEAATMLAEMVAPANAP